MPSEMMFYFMLFAYILLLLFVSVLFKRRMQTLEDFFLASRNLPAFLVFLSLAASWLGATSILVSMDEAYRQGVSSFWVMGMPAILTVLVFAFFLARPIRHLPIVTLPDLVEMRYGRIVRHLSSVLIVWYMILLTSSQMVAVGSFLREFLGTSYVLGLLIGTSIVLIYSIFGGFFSVVVTDCFQFFLIIVGAASMFFLMSNASSFKDIPFLASELGKEGYFQFFFDIKRNFLICLSFTMAWIISPIVWQRIQAARTEKKAQQGLYAAAGTFFLYYVCIVFLGMLSLSLFPSGVHEGPILSAVMLLKPGTIASGIIFVAVMAAVMSTMDTAINTGAMSLTRDIYQEIFHSGKKDNIVSVSRWATFIVGACAFLVATKFQSILIMLGLSSEIMAEGLFIPGIAMIFLKKKYPMAGILSLVLGGGYAIFGFFCQARIIPINWPEWPFSVPYGLGLSMVGFVVGIVVEKIRKETSNKL